MGSQGLGEGEAECALRRISRLWAMMEEARKGENISRVRGLALAPRPAVPRSCPGFILVFGFVVFPFEVVSFTTVCVSSRGASCALIPQKWSQGRYHEGKRLFQLTQEKALPVL